MDLSKLSPAPWNCGDERGHNETEDYFIALARNAFDVMMRRWWYAQPEDDGWSVVGSGFSEVIESRHADPFTALVEADKWYKENVEKYND
jgi:hypothetical protein